MGRKFVDLSGQRFGKLIAVSREYNGRSSVWLCKCDCGNQSNVAYTELVRGNTRSCGCIKRSANGMSDHYLYKTWDGMLARCQNPENKDFKNYGGRGIKVCPQWQNSFENFLSDMGDRPEGYSLERLDNNDNYSPENCAWVSKKEQAWNTRKSRMNRFTSTDINNIYSLYKNGRHSFREIAKIYDTNLDFINGVCVARENSNDHPFSLGFSNVSLVPKNNICTSRLEADISSEVVRGLKIEVPFIAANMSTVSNAYFCIALRKLGALGILHRAAPTEFLVLETKKIAEVCDVVGVSIGVGQEQEELARHLVEAGANLITIDVANGYSEMAIETARRIKNNFPEVKIILGNTTHVGLLLETADFVDAIKVGIAQGFACETANTAAHTEGQFSAVLKFKELSRKYGVPIISDGGIREPADFVKAIAAGANGVMAGMVFARCPESAGETLSSGDGSVKKVYAGMASRYVQKQWKGGLKEGTCPEGKMTLIDLGENVEALIERYSGALRSGITYGGAKDVSGFQDNADFVRLR